MVNYFPLHRHRCRACGCIWRHAFACGHDCPKCGDEDNDVMVAEHKHPVKSPRSFIAVNIWPPARWEPGFPGVA